MSLLALDLGTKCGYALYQSPGNIVSGTAEFKTDRFSGGGMRYLRFKRWLDEIHAATPITEVAFEEVRRHVGTTAAHVYGGLLATLTAWCEEKSIPYGSETVQAIKKFACGKGGGPGTDKVAMIAAVKDKWGFVVGDDNEADAIALLHLRLYDVLN